MGGKYSFPVVSLPNDRVVVVTGASAGIGYETAKWIAMMGATVILACRSEDKAMQAIRKIDAEYKELRGKGVTGLVEVESLSMEFMELDLASFQSTKNFVEAFKKTERQLHVLICNAGIFKDKLETTEDGYEAMLQVNYLSHSLMIGQLLPLMKTSGEDTRIVLVSSGAHSMCKYDLENMNYSGDRNKFSGFDFYGRSKLYQVMQMFSLQRRLRNSNISVSSLHPGMVETEIGRDVKDNRMFQIFSGMARLFGIMLNLEDGAATTVNAVVNPDLKGVGGVYYIKCKPASVSSTARDETKQEELWKQTLQFLKGHLSEEEVLCLEGADPS